SRAWPERSRASGGMTIQDKARSTVSRVDDLMASMTLEEKLAQIVGFWQDEAGDAMAPLQGEQSKTGVLAEATKDGLGQFTRVYGTSPVEPLGRAKWLWQAQRDLI